MIYSYGTFVPNTFAGSPFGEVAREARLALNFGVRVESFGDGVGNGILEVGRKRPGRIPLKGLGEGP